MLQDWFDEKLSSAPGSATILAQPKTEQMTLAQTELKDRVERPCRLIVDRDDANTGTNVAAVTLENDSGERTYPFMCPSERSVDEVVDRLLDIYPDISIVA